MISPPPNEIDFNSQPWQKWFSDVYEQFRNLSTSGDIVTDNSARGVVLKDGTGNYWRVSISTAGALTTINLGKIRPQGV